MVTMRYKGKPAWHVRVLVPVLVVVLTVVAGVAAIPNAASAADEFPSGEFYIRNVASGLVLDVRDGSTEDGAEVVLSYLADDPGQRWTYDMGFLVNSGSGLCLEVPGMTSGGAIPPGTALVQSARREPPENLNQLWAYNFRFLTPYDPKVVIAAQGNELEPGARAVVERQIGFSDNPEQQWLLDSV